MPYNTIDPLFSSDGKYVSFISDRDGDNKNFDTYVMDSQGKGLRKISEHDGYNLPLWFLNKRQLLISTNGSGSWEIYRINLNNPILKKLTNGIAFSISPDGTEVLVQSDENGYNEIYLLNLDGKKRSLSDPIKNKRGS